MDEDLQFEMSDISTIAEFLDISVSVTDDRLIFDIYHKPTNSFNYLKYSSCHPKHTKCNIALSLGRRIVRICSENFLRQKKLKELEQHLLAAWHPKTVIDEAFSKLFAPSQKQKNVDHIAFTRTFNPTQNPNFHKIQNCLNNLNSFQMQKAFKDKIPRCTTRQPTNLRKLVVKAKFQLCPPISREPKSVGLVPCGKCKFCNLGYIQRATQFTMNHRSKPITWIYNRLFTCDSVRILYVVMCTNCTNVYVGKAKSLKSRVSKHASDVRHPHNSKCRKCTDHLRDCSEMKEPFFHFYPFFYVDDPSLCHFSETRFRIRWKPTLNTY